MLSSRLFTPPHAALFCFAFFFLREVLLCFVSFVLMMPFPFSPPSWPISSRREPLSLSLTPLLRLLSRGDEKPIEKWWPTDGKQSAEKPIENCGDDMACFQARGRGRELAAWCCWACRFALDRRWVANFVFVSFNSSCHGLSSSPDVDASTLFKFFTSAKEMLRWYYSLYEVRDKITCTA